MHSQHRLRIPFLRSRSSRKRSRHLFSAGRVTIGRARCYLYAVSSALVGQACAGAPQAPAPLPSRLRSLEAFKATPSISEVANPSAGEDMQVQEQETSKHTLVVRPMAEVR